jgi:hypothetical protein
MKHNQYFSAVSSSNSHTSVCCYQYVKNLIFSVAQPAGATLYNPWIWWTSIQRKEMFSLNKLFLFLFLDCCYMAYAWSSLNLSLHLCLYSHFSYMSVVVLVGNGCYIILGRCDKHHLLIILTLICIQKVVTVIILLKLTHWLLTAVFRRKILF